MTWYHVQKLPNGNPLHGCYASLAAKAAPISPLEAIATDTLHSETSMDIV